MTVVVFQRAVLLIGNEYECFSLRLNRIAVLAAEELLDKNGIANIKIVSDSMEPFIKTGEHLTFRSKAVCKRPKFGDVILCKSEI